MDNKFFQSKRGGFGMNNRLDEWGNRITDFNEFMTLEERAYYGEGYDEKR